MSGSERARGQRKDYRFDTIAKLNNADSERLAQPARKLNDFFGRGHDSRTGVGFGCETETKTVRDAIGSKLTSKIIERGFQVSCPIKAITS